MRISLVFLQIILVAAFSCSDRQRPVNTDELNLRNSYSTIINLEDNSTPTVDIPKYTLISDSQRDRRNDASEILRLKRKWPVAMQSLDPIELDSILGKHFTFKGTDNFFTRADYIENRTTPDEWKIIFVKYDNVTLQFFGDTGVLSYVNHITNKNTGTGAIEYEHISWVDIYVLEDGKWKI